MVQVMGSTSDGLGLRPSTARSPPNSAATEEKHAVSQASAACHPSISGTASSTVWPNSSSSFAAPSTAPTHSGCTSVPSIDRVVNATFSCAGRRSIISRNVRSGGGSAGDAPGTGPHERSSMAALSRTERARTCSVPRPSQISPSMGSMGRRPRLGLRPKRPHQLDGMRIDPPMSLPRADRHVMPAATDAPEPPLEPPGECSRLHGFRVGPCSSGSVVAMSANSGVLVRPTTTRPADLMRRTRSLS